MTDLENKLNEIKELIKLSSSCDGKVFGEFVRNVIVPNSDVAKFNQIDIWFKGKNDADNFILKAKIHFNFLKIDNHVYALYYNNTHTIFVKIVISKFLPVNDFDVNCLTYYYHGDDFFFGREILTIKPELLITSIKNKTGLMFYDYGKNLDQGKIKKIKQDFLEKGWKIRYNGQDLSGQLVC